VELAKSVQKLTSLLRGKPRRGDRAERALTDERGDTGIMKIQFYGCCSSDHRTRFFEIIAWLPPPTWLARVGEKSGSVLPDPPEVRGRNHEGDPNTTGRDNAEGHDVFSFNGKASAPVIRAWPGITLKIELHQ